MADALWPDAGPDDDRMTYACARINLDSELPRAVDSGALPVKDPLTLGPHTYPFGTALKTARVTVCDLRKFLAGRLDVEVSPEPQQTALATDAAKPAPEVALGASGGVELDKTVPAKPLQRTAAQDSAILSEIEKQGHNPMALPKNHPGKPGAKAAIRTALKKNSLFTGGTVFDKAWERLPARGDIVIHS